MREGPWQGMLGGIRFTDNYDEVIVEVEWAERQEGTVWLTHIIPPKH